MRSLICNSCNKEFFDQNEQKIHYKSEWHRYNLKRKVAGVPGLTEALFVARQSALAEETSLLYSCVHCGKEYTSSKAHAQHLKSKTHLSQALQEPVHHDENSVMIIKPLPHQPSEWEEVDKEEEMVDELNDEDSDVDECIDPCYCFMCDLKHDTIENCTVHMHKQHGFFLPDVEYLKDAKGFLTYLGLKVKRDYVCLYCNDRCRPFSSLEAVRKHMEAKSHCKVHYGDGGDDEEAELEEFYDYSSSYVDATGKQLISSEDFNNNVQLGSGGSELIITTRTDDGLSVKAIGSREFLRYYRQKPRPTRIKDAALAWV
ncbi:cytoplasmic 60S subunit biogenesis factor REI1 homolog 1-like [Solanum dulcamara]|uniref:cytoplasmic 60S subunit biogenesis factor REI1 homolog 1-like n=1 Tax=Solanum dulcamara TaxID=45834 RepID=UPI002485145A|nr:cytoplasmic 60S subunit biogenesis factor REI1 homolog 1-like [Solanum dulcamara]